MPRVFGGGSRSQPAALVSDQPIPASTGIWCRQEMACSGKPCRQSANPTPVPCSSTSKRSPLASTNLVCISGIQHIDLIRQYRGGGAGHGGPYGDTSAIEAAVVPSYPDMRQELL